MTRHRALAGAVLLFGLVVGASPASAQESPATAEARVHFERAVALFGSGDARGALAEFQRAYDLSGRTSVLYNIGASYQALHDYPRAIEALRRYLAAGDARPGPQRELASRALRQMEPLVAQLRVVRVPADATVTVDDRALTDDRVTVGPGPHTLSATAPGHEPRQLQVTVVSGDDREVRIALSRVASPTPTLTGVVAPPTTPTAPSSRVPFWATVFAGSALAVGASITGGLAIATQDDYASRHADDPEAPGLASRGHTLALTADLLGLGALGAGTVALVLGLRSRGHRAPPAVVVRIDPSGASLVAHGTF